VQQKKEFKHLEGGKRDDDTRGSFRTPAGGVVHNGKDKQEKLTRTRTRGSEEGLVSYDAFIHRSLENSSSYGTQKVIKRSVFRPLRQNRGGAGLRVKRRNFRGRVHPNLSAVGLWETGWAIDMGRASGRLLLAERTPSRATKTIAQGVGRGKSASRAFVQKPKCLTTTDSSKGGRRGSAKAGSHRRNQRLSGGALQSPPRRA